MEKGFMESNIIPLSKKVVEVTAKAEGTSYSLSALEQTVQCIATAGALTLTLPNVTEMMGKFVAIHCKDLTAPSTVVVQDNDESLGWSDMTLTADNDCALLYSDGLKWWKVVDVTT
jgi:hypothetical protein